MKVKDNVLGDDVSRVLPCSIFVTIVNVTAHLTMKLSDQIKACHDSQPFYTFEFFPPRTDQVRLGQLFQIILLALILSRHPGI